MTSTRRSMSSSVIVALSVLTAALPFGRLAKAQSAAPVHPEAGDAVVVPAAPPAEALATARSEPPAAAPTYSAQIVLADVSAVVVANVAVRATGNPLPALTWVVASPIVHGAHGHWGRAGVSALLHVGLPAVGIALGLFADHGAFKSDAPDGALIGGTLGFVAATVVDAAVLARLSDEAPRPAASATTAASAPAVTVAGNGDVTVGWRGTF